MNNHFDVGIYQVFEQIPGLPFKYEEFKIRAKTGIHSFSPKPKKENE